MGSILAFLRGNHSLHTKVTDSRAKHLAYTFVLMVSIFPGKINTILLRLPSIGVNLKEGEYYTGWRRYLIQ